MRRFMIIVLGFVCTFTVIILGNTMHVSILEDNIKKSVDNRRVYSEYELWEQKKLRDNKDYDNLWILINIDEKLLYLIDLDENVVLKKYPVATGKEKTPTPIGNFKIIQKGKWGAGFGTRWMGLNVPWGKYGIHGTNRPNSIGFNASAGCIRMRNRDVEDLYSKVKYNTPVTIAKGNFGPFGHGFRVLRPGDRGSDVQEVQKRLKQKGYYHGGIDGIYGEGTKAALIKFLKDNNEELTDKVDFNIYKKLGIILMD